jgi:hypothetical protein
MLLSERRVTQVTADAIHAHETVNVPKSHGDQQRAAVYGSQQV